MHFFSRPVLCGAVRSLPLLVCAVPVLLAATAANADTFSIAGTLQSGGSVSGTVNIDPSTNTASAINLAVTGHGLNGITGTDVTGTYLGPTLGWEFFSAFFPAGPGQQEFGLDLLVPESSIQAPAGGPLCSVSSACTIGPSQLTFGLGSTDKLQAGTITPVAATPEPASLALLGTGTLAAFGALRRRLRS